MKKRRGTKRPKWHLHGGVNFKTGKTRFVGDHPDAHYAPKPEGKYAVRVERHIVKRTLKHAVGVDAEELEIAIPASIVSEANWRGA
jgi:hypothetical protein